MIKNLLFDLGGVIMDIRRENAVDALKQIGLAEADELLGLYEQKGPFMLLEEGKITPVDFRNEIRSRIPHEVSDSEIDNAFLCFLTGIPVSRLRQLEELSASGLNLYLLSNTNPIMWNTRIREEFQKDGKDINHYFKGLITSFEAKMMKPDPEIFRYAAETLGIKPEETLFIDDSQKNLDAAASVGYHTALVPPGTEFIDKITL
ncbi:MAG: HAD family phosphatase [Muribaculaceae bacterium]|nr:HAD family phosphatase [Muribaculaceae bacterium]